MRKIAMNYKEHQSPELAIMRCILMLLLFFLVTSVVFAQSQPQPAPSLSDDEYRSRDLAIKERALENEDKKAWIAALGTGVPILLGLLTLTASIFSVRRTVIAQFTTKAAELALQGEGVNEVLHRAALLAQMYPKLLPKDFRNSLAKIEPQEIGRIFTQSTFPIALRAEVIKLLAANPQQREQILTDYQNLFSGYPYWQQLRSGSAPTGLLP
jgi:hypothetical protein